MKQLDSRAIRKDFPILDQEINEEPLVYLDNAATTQKPNQVLAALMAYYQKDNANVHRGVHTLSERATVAYEAARKKVADFIHARSEREILFTRGTTTSLNWVARFAEEQLQAGDEVVVSIMEHHSNLIPWQEVCRKTGAKLRYVYLREGELDLEELARLLHSRTKFVSLTHASNVLGTINPIREIAELVHQVGAYLVVDGAQSIPHMMIDVQELDVDFFAFSGHKMLGPTGIGVLYGKEEHLEQMTPVEFGGEMIALVEEQTATWKDIPWKFEAGTPPIAEAIGLGVAIDYLQAVGMEAIHSHTSALLAYLFPKLQAIEGLTLYGSHDLSKRTGVIAFNLEGIHPHDLATALDYQGIAVRAGHHCAQPLLRYLGVPATARASFYLYNTEADCDALVEAIYQAKEFFHGTI